MLELTVDYVAGAPPVRRARRIVPGREAPPRRRPPRASSSPDRSCTGPPGPSPTDDPDAAVHVSMAKAKAADAAHLTGRQAAPVPRRHRLHDRVRPAPLPEASLGARRARGATRHVPPRAAVAGARSCSQPIDRRKPLMPEAYIVDAVRTPVGRRGGGLVRGPPGRSRRARRSGALVERNDVDPPRSTTSCSAASTQHRPPGRRHRADRAGWPPATPRRCPARPIDRQCGSSQQAVHFAAQAVMSGTNDLIVAGGVQNMSVIPITAAMLAGGAVRVRATRSRARRAGSRATATRRCRSSAARR